MCIEKRDTPSIHLEYVYLSLTQYFYNFYLYIYNSCLFTLTYVINSYKKPPLELSYFSMYVL